MHFDRYTEEMAISDCGLYSISKEEPLPGCWFRTARFHPDKDYRFGLKLGDFYKYAMARQACVDHKNRNPELARLAEEFKNV